jgi:hypothetical protein
MSIQETQNGLQHQDFGAARPWRVKWLAVVLYLFGGVLVLAGVLSYSSSKPLDFLLSGFGIFPVPQAVIGLVVISIGLINIGTGIGVWRLKNWGLALGLAVSLVQVAIGALANDFSSFIFIRGVIVLVLLLRTRDLFRL